MTRTVRATFDGGVFRPEEPIELRPNATYVITIEGEEPEEGQVAPGEAYPLIEIAKLATDLGVDDPASSHDWYAHRASEDPDIDG